MARTSIIAATAALIATLAAPAFADTLKPLQAASFNVGSEHAVSYFTSENGRCNLVVTRAGEPNDSFTVTRYETSISPGQSAHYERSANFTCAAEAQSMQFDRHIQLTDAQ
jgi:hypothetical protein